MTTRYRNGPKSVFSPLGLISPFIIYCQDASQTSDNSTKLQSSKQHGIGTKTDIRSLEQTREPRNKPTHLWSINL